MVGSRKLSNDEVEALLSGLDEESKDETAQQFDPNEVREFKFGTEDLSLLGDYYALRMINEKICRFTRSVFLPMLRIMPRISSFPPEVKSFDEYVESCDNFVSVTNSRIEELRGNALLVIEAPFVSHLTNSYYGGFLYFGVFGSPRICLLDAFRQSKGVVILPFSYLEHLDRFYFLVSLGNLRI